MTLLWLVTGAALVVALRGVAPGAPDRASGSSRLSQMYWELEVPARRASRPAAARHRATPPAGERPPPAPPGDAFTRSRREALTMGSGANLLAISDSGPHVVPTPRGCRAPRSSIRSSSRRDSLANAYDVVVIGAGTGGYVAAIRAAQLGMKVAVVEKQKALGGTCLIWGCIPTKALLEHAHALKVIQNAKEWGVTLPAGTPAIDMGQVQARKDKIVSGLTKGIEFLFKKNKIDWIKGTARLAGQGKVEVVRGREADARGEGDHRRHRLGAAQRARASRSITSGSSRATRRST